jgi:hypothetical protein
MGVMNVAERLSAHFGSDATLSSGPRAEGGFLNAIRIPLHRAL